MHYQSDITLVEWPRHTHIKAPWGDKNTYASATGLSGVCCGKLKSAFASDGVAAEQQDKAMHKHETHFTGGGCMVPKDIDPANEYPPSKFTSHKKEEVVNEALRLMGRNWSTHTAVGDPFKLQGNCKPLIPFMDIEILTRLGRTKIQHGCM